MPSCRERFAAMQLRRFSNSWNHEAKESFIDITGGTAASSCYSVTGIISSTSEELSSTNQESNSNKELERFNEDELVVECLLGKGGFSNVFRMRHRKTKRVFAVKQLRESVRENEKKLAVCAAELAVETTILANLNHENIIKLHGIRGDGTVVDLLKMGTFFMCLDPLDETLFDKMSEWREQTAGKKHRFLRGNRAKVESDIVKRLKDVAVGIAKGMEYLHSKNIIYRDVKPGNIGFDEKSGEVKIFDFGLARVVSEETETDEDGYQARLMTRRVGTPRYMAPEIARGMTSYSFGVDVYSFSILLWQMVTDQIAFEDVHSPSQLKRAVAIDKLRPSIECVKSKSLKILIESSWSDCPEKRPTFKTIREELGCIINNSSGKDQKQSKQRKRAGGLFRKSSSH